MYYSKYTIIFLISFFLGCSSYKDDFKLPLRKGNIWFYEVTGFRSSEKFAPLRPELLDSLGSQSYRIKEIPQHDTIRVYIQEIKELGKDSTLYKFSEDFVRFWGSEILFVKNGYKRFFQDYGEPYLIKFPIRSRNSWKNLFPLTSEICEIISVDTTITLNDRVYQNCLAIDIQQSREGRKHHIQTFFNEKFGLVYYKDHDSSDEIKLVKMEEKP